MNVLMQMEIQDGNSWSEVKDPDKSIAGNRATGRTPGQVFIEQPISTRHDNHPVNGKHGPDDEDEDEAEEEDLILGDADEAGDEEEFDVELEEDFDGEIDDDDLVIDSDEDVEDEEDDL